ncbi:hypothetical protein J6590_003677 [Homalodisca vitripennis]|nr:hypothetical protein J6590_003677 [Homalodisca vitripennis]
MACIIVLSSCKIESTCIIIQFEAACIFIIDGLTIASDTEPTLQRRGQVKVKWEKGVRCHQDAIAFPITARDTVRCHDNNALSGCNFSNPPSPIPPEFITIRYCPSASRRFVTTNSLIDFKCCLKLHFCTGNISLMMAHVTFCEHFDIGLIANRDGIEEIAE